MCEKNGAKESTGECTGGEAERLDLDIEGFEAREIVP